MFIVDCADYRLWQVTHHTCPLAVRHVCSASLFLLRCHNITRKYYNTSFVHSNNCNTFAVGSFLHNRKKTDSYSNAMDKKLETERRDYWDENADTVLAKCL